MATVTPEEANRILHKLADSLTETRKLRQDYAVAVRAGAVRKAGMRPSPQARLAAQGLRARNGAVLGFPGTRVATSGGRTVKLGAISFGAEYGSDQHAQFAPRRESGYFLNPAAEQVDDRPGEAWLDDVIDGAIRSRGR